MTTPIDRRRFLRGATAGLGAVTLNQLLTACGSNEARPPQAGRNQDVFQIFDLTGKAAIVTEHYTLDQMVEYQKVVTGMAAVQTSIPLGVSTAVAVALHEVPQQVGDFAVLLHAGYRRGPALGLSVLSAAGAVTGTVVSFLAFGALPGVLPYALAVAAASFLYIAMADLMPDLHKGHVDVSAFEQLLLLAAGIATAFWLRE